MGKRIKGQIKKIITYRITTSGYADRYIITDSVYTYRRKDVHFKTDRKGLVAFLTEMLDVEFDIAFDAVYECETEYRISGWINKEHWQSTNMSREEAAGIDAYLSLTTMRDGQYTQAAIKRWTNYLCENPLPENIRAIVDYQIEKCDRENEYFYGRKDGRDALHLGGSRK